MACSSGGGLCGSGAGANAGARRFTFGLDLDQPHQGATAAAGRRTWFLRGCAWCPSLLIGGEQQQQQGAAWWRDQAKSGAYRSPVDLSPSAFTRPHCNGGRVGAGTCRAGADGRRCRPAACSSSSGGGPCGSGAGVSPGARRPGARRPPSPTPSPLRDTNKNEIVGWRRRLTAFQAPISTPPRAAMARICCGSGLASTHLRGHSIFASARLDTKPPHCG